MPGEREEISFRSGEDDCAAWLYPPAGDAGAPPVVVMGHGFSLTRHDGLDLYARPLADAGVAVLAFDYRYLGDSGGEPRQRFRKRAQLEDWRNAIALARSRKDLDGGRVILWGYSFGGGHVTTLAAQRDDLAAALVLSPFLNGLQRGLNVRPSVGAWILPRAVADLAGRHVTIPVTGPEGSRGMMTLAGEGEGFARAVAPDSPWRNEISPGIFATVAVHRPFVHARRIGSPLWVGLGDRDTTVHGRSIERLAQRAPRAELHRYDADHFDPFTEPTAGKIAADQVEFLDRVLAAAR